MATTVETGTGAEVPHSALSPVVYACALLAPWAVPVLWPKTVGLRREDRRLVLSAFVYGSVMTVAFVAIFVWRINGII